MENSKPQNHHISGLRRIGLRKEKNPLESCFPGDLIIHSKEGIKSVIHI